MIVKTGINVNEVELVIVKTNPMIDVGSYTLIIIVLLLIRVGVSN